MRGTICDRCGEVVPEGDSRDFRLRLASGGEAPLVDLGWDACAKCAGVIVNVVKRSIVIDSTMKDSIVGAALVKTPTARKPRTPRVVTPPPVGEDIPLPLDVTIDDMANAMKEESGSAMHDINRGLPPHEVALAEANATLAIVEDDAAPEVEDDEDDDIEGVD